MKNFKYNNRYEFYKQVELFPTVDIIESDKMDKWLEDHRIKITIGDCTLDLEWDANIADSIESVLEDIRGYYEED